MTDYELHKTIAPCPFCGSDRVAVRLYNQPSVVCENCLCMGPAADRLTKAPDNLNECITQAEELWNKRKDFGAK